MSELGAPAVELEHVTKIFRPPPAPWRRWLRLPALPETVALRDVTLDLRPGEILGLVGPNGAGKTVLVKLIATLTEPTAGRVRVNGRDPAHEATAIRAAVGLATCDERSFYWRLTGRQNLAFFARLHGIDRRAARRTIAALDDALDLRAALDRTYSVLTAGNRQRLAIARALLAAPSVLLLDEPTRSLDPAAADRLRALIAARLGGDARRAILLTTHAMEEVEQLCTRVAVLDHGELLACAELPSLRARYGLAATVTVTVRAPVPRAELDALAASVPGLACDHGRNGSIALRFPRAPDDDRIHVVMSTLLRAGCRIVDCRTDVPSGREVYDRVLQRGRGDG